MTTALLETLAEGRFRILEVIGEGGMATVYRAFDVRLQRPRAVKVLSPALAQRPALRKRFLAEAQTMANLEESRVVRIFDTGEDGDHVYIVMELIEGGSLLDRVRDFGPLPPRMAAEATIQICESIQAAHDAGVIHRDIKPHNILLTRTGEIRVTDFGIAQVQADNGGDGMTRTGAIMGTWGFMAPEQKTNAKQVDVRADVYSVGATLWSLLRGETPPELFMAESEAGMLDEMPEELAEVVKRATRYRREDRYLSARAMAESLRALVSMLPEDPELTVPLVGHTLERPQERPIRRMDTIQQFATDVRSDGVDPLETMVPPIADLARLGSEPSLPTREPASTSGERAGALIAPIGDRPGFAAKHSGKQARRPLSGETYTQDPPRSAMPWMLAAGAILVALSITAGGVGYLVWVSPGNNPVTAAPVPSDKVPVVTVPVDTVPVDTVPVVPDVAPDVPPAAVAGTSSPAITGGKPPRQPRGTQATSSAVAAPAPTPEAAVAVVAPVAAPRAELSHSVPAAARVGDMIPFAATLPDAGWTVKLYYRPASGGPYDSKTMSGAGSTYTTSFKATEAMAGGVAYFISAAKGSATLKEGSAMSPKKVAVTP